MNLVEYELNHHFRTLQWCLYQFCVHFQTYGMDYAGRQLPRTHKQHRPAEGPQYETRTWTGQTAPQPDRSQRLARPTAVLDRHLVVTCGRISGLVLYQQFLSCQEPARGRPMEINFKSHCTVYISKGWYLYVCCFRPMCKKCGCLTSYKFTESSAWLIGVFVFE